MPPSDERLAEIRVAQPYRGQQSWRAEDGTPIGRATARDDIDDLLEAYDELRAEVERLRKQHSDLTSRMGFGDGVTEPQADNDTIMRAWEEMSSQSTEWCESQSWRTDCYLAGHSDTEDCHEHDPSLQLSDARAEIEQLRAQVAAVEALNTQQEGVSAGWRRVVGLYRAALASGDEVRDA